MKKIEKQKFYHKTNWHKKCLTFNFSQGLIKITTKDEKGKDLLFADILACTDSESSAVKSKKSGSVMGRFTSR